MNKKYLISYYDNKKNLCAIVYAGRYVEIITDAIGYPMDDNGCFFNGFLIDQNEQLIDKNKGCVMINVYEIINNFEEIEFYELVKDFTNMQMKKICINIKNNHNNEITFIEDIDYDEEIEYNLKNNIDVCYVGKSCSCHMII